MQTNGTTFFIRNPLTGEPKMTLCNLSIDLGETTRVKDDEKCLENKDQKGDSPGTELEAADTVIEGYWEPDSETQTCYCVLLIDGKPDETGTMTLDEQLITDAVIAFCDGCAIPIRVWVHKLKLLAITPDNKLKYRVTLATMSCWCVDKFNWLDGTAPPELTDFQTAITAYYDSLDDGQTAQALQTSLQGKLGEDKQPARPATAKKDATGKKAA